MKRFLEEINITIKEKKLTEKELINLDDLTKTYFNFHDNSLSEYGVYDKNDLEKTNIANREITVVIERFKKILYKITEKVMYHMIQQKYKNKGKLNRHDFTDEDVEEQD